MSGHMKLSLWFAFFTSWVALPSWSQNYLRVKPDLCQNPPSEQPLEQVLPCYLLQPDSHYQWKITHQSDVGNGTATLYTVHLTSLKWTAGEQAGVDYPLWQHRVSVYVPKVIRYRSALLYINGGSLYPALYPAIKAPEPDDKEINFLKIALDTQSVVINLKDIPNQRLTFKDSLPLKEDDLIAYTWKQFLDNPKTHRQWPLRLPMVKSSIRTMDMVQELLAQEKIKIDRFVVSGGSKRGWTAWLTAAMDERVSAVVPMVTDVLNLRPNMHHHYKAYGRWAPAVKSYLPLMPRLDTPEMDELLAIVDPFSYREQLSMPKYIINASADDFFLPDSGRFYLPDLPGNKWVRVLSNLRHYIVRMQPDLVTETLEAFYGAFIEERPLPSINWEVREQTLVVRSSTPPKSALLWRAYNPTHRDFRITPDNPDIQNFQSEPVKFYCKENCRFEFNMEKTEKGWSAYFVEISFSNRPYADLTFSTRIFIYPEVYPDHKKN